MLTCWGWQGESLTGVHHHLADDRLRIRAHQHFYLPHAHRDDRNRGHNGGAHLDERAPLGGAKAEPTAPIAGNRLTHAPKVAVTPQAVIVASFV